MVACAACSFHHRRCTHKCVFAPYFPPTYPQKYVALHRVYGESNVAKIINDLPPDQRQDAVDSLYYEAEARIRDPVYGCFGLISCLQEQLKKLQQDLVTAKEELAGYMGSDAMILGRGDHQGMSNGYGVDNNGLVTATGFNQMDVNGHRAGGSLPGLSLALGIGDAYQTGKETDAANGSVTATGLNQMDVNGHGTGGSLSGLSFALGIGDAYQKGQEETDAANGTDEEEEEKEELEPLVKRRKSGNKAASI